MEELKYEILDDIDITPISFQPGFEVSEKQVFDSIKKLASNRLR